MLSREIWLIPISQLRKIVVDSISLRVGLIRGVGLISGVDLYYTVDSL